MMRLSMQTKMTGLIFFIVAFSLFLASIVVINNFVQSKENDLEQRALITSRTVAEMPEIREKIEKDSKNINQIVEPIRIIHGAYYVVVMNMNHERLSHPLQSMIGKISKGDDEGQAFAEHTYTDKAKGEGGMVIRSFVPVVNDQHEQVGVVVSGYLLPKFIEVILSLKKEIFLISGLALFFGGWGAWALASRIKKEMFELEPHEIARLFVERTETFNAMHEGVIAIDKEENITIFNHKAKIMMDVPDEVIGKKIYDVIPDTRLPEILQLNQPVYNRELQVRNLNILSNRVPIKVNNHTVGAVAIFQDRTEVKKLAEELTGVKSFVSALRVQNHEYMNKLHTIAGLIQLGNKDKALQYVFQVSEQQEELTQFLHKHIKDESISGLLLSKVSRAKELGIELAIDRHSELHSFPPYLDHHDFVIIIGNLIENAFDSYQHMERCERKIYISMEQNDGILSILVEDNGCGMNEDQVERIFDEGFSTKAKENRGIGLHLVKQIVEKGNGQIEVESELDVGTTFIITFFL
ncbi:sensor histidine kinase [Priestia megaterium]|uniref:sensor histidine kinase n=1 Tax=Priestia megaterium TaxID=1404 RepID=UPI002453198B|nr:sensor histidine kinase [Priestia megaterium]MDH3143921.1 sensor histidine kinase [Priestia megaterium]MED4236129.1 sensor histidine kinase [Priestia megaterium]MED4253774.1 sensor histidine kinase [Priestia megaterium]MED4263176.1 sensor histidine kinase [Priestia megaterium]MED4276944.1 sensor histidine kinase [Priestia megaterium]